MSTSVEKTDNPYAISSGPVFLKDASFLSTITSSSPIISTTAATTEDISKIELELNKINDRITDLDLSINRRLDELKSLIELAIMVAS